VSKEGRDGRDAELAKLLAARYGLSISEITPGPRGWVGETYIVTERGGDRVFVKVYPSGLLPPPALPALPALAELSRLGVRGISKPITSATGSLHERMGVEEVVVFEYIEGTLTRSFDKARLGELIAHVHDASARLTLPVSRETFTPAYIHEFWPVLTRARDDDGALDGAARGLRPLLAGIWSRLQNDWTRFAEVARQCREARFDLVLTHGDSLFNVIEDAAGELHLVDWDELILAPAERDTWFYTSGPEFLNGYRRRRPEYVENELVRDYYVRHRYLEELISFSRTALGVEGRPTTARRLEALALIDGPWMRGLRARFATGTGER
jgi:spectinomycin phosphotransferase